MLEENAKLKDSINKELETKVAERTYELETSIAAVNYQAGLLKEQNDQLIEQKLELMAISDDLTNQSNELRSINTVLQRSNKTKDKLFSIIGHDLKNPIGNIKAILDISLKEIGNKEVDEVKKHLSLAQHSASKTKELLDNLLHWAISQTETISYKPSNYSLGTLVREVVSEQRNLLAQKNISSSVDIPDTLTAFVDKDLISIVLRNLLTNSIKFTPREGSIQFHTFLHENMAVLAVKDTGIGIENPEGLIKNEIFNKTEGTEGEVSTGLGYSIVRDFIAINKGKLDIKSNVGEGTTVFLYLPLEDTLVKEEPKTILKEEPVKVIATKSQINKQISGKKILIIDDEEIFTESLRYVFVPENTVYIAHNGIEGFASAQREAPDIILCDLNMPEINGFELSKKLKEDSSLRHIPVLLLTASDERDVKNQALDLGFEDFIAKPIDNESLIAKIKSIFKNREILKTHLSVHLLSNEKTKSFKNKDEEFVHKVIELIKNHVEEPYLSVEFIASEMGVSRAQLFRKMKELAGETPNDFIKMVRMQLAKSYFDLGETHIAEVAYKVGFSDPQYFSTCFLKAFGVSPRNYSRQHKEA